MNNTQSNPNPHFGIIAGETSGDIHGAALVAEIKKINPGATFEGLGGPKMRAAGVDLYEDMTQISVMGIFEVLAKYADFRRIFYSTLSKFQKKQPDAVILIDFPGFNLKMADKLKKAGIKVIYYISPKLWAWKEKRIEQVRKSVDHMLVIFEFEKEFYARHGIESTFVGNPLVDLVKANTPKDLFLQQNGLSDFKLTIGILPGSRKKEIERILPPMLGAVKLLKSKFPQLQFLLIKAQSISEEYLKTFISDGYDDLIIVDGSTYDALNASDICIVASGTATLETGLLGKPMVIVYKMNALTYYIARLVVKIPYVGLVNIISNQNVVPELLQHDANPTKIAQTIESIFTDEIKLAEIKNSLKKLEIYLGEKNASYKAASEVLRIVDSQLSGPQSSGQLQ